MPTNCPIWKKWINFQNNKLPKLKQGEKEKLDQYPAKKLNQ